MESSDTPPGRSIEPADLVGTIFADRFRVLRLASQGANTLIYDAGDEQTGRTVTLKLVRPALAASPKFRASFDERMRAVAALSHPNIAAVYDWGIARIGRASTSYVVIEHLTGGSLRDMFDRRRQISPSQALVVGLDVCRGLDHAHRRGFVHAELTPSKLVFGDDRRLRIVDFGLAELLSEQAWADHDEVSSHIAWYASPEQAQSLPIDGKTDVYALCLALHEAVTGTLPFKFDSSVASLSARIGKLMPVSADLGPLASVFERAGRPEPDERASAAEFGKGLVKAASKLPRPEPLPLLSTGLFETPVDQMRSPDDPTGGVTRPPRDVPKPVVVVPVDEPGPATSDPGTPDAGPSDAPGEAAVAAAAAGLAAGVAASRTGDAPPGGASLDARPTDADAPTDGGEHARTDAAEGSVARVAEPEIEPPEIIEAEPDREIPRVDPEDDLVILPLDTGISTGADEASTTATQTSATSIEADDPNHAEPNDAEPDDHTPNDGEPSDDAPDDRPGVPTAPGAAKPPADTAVIPVAEAAPERTRRPRGFPWKIVISLLVIGALVMLGILATRLFQTPTYTVPDLQEMPEAEALNLISTNEWDVSISRERSDQVPNIGEVVRTVPSAGIALAEGEPFLMVVSEGPTLRELPESTGVPLSEAQTRLVERGLAVETEEIFDEVVPVGTVISWSVPGEPTLVAGAEVEPETEVLLVVSLGPAPREVPGVVGRPVGEARASVEGLGLVFIEGPQEFSDDVSLGVVISQDIEPGTEVDRGAELTVVVSKGPDLILFPDISGAANYDETSQILVEAGFTPVLTFGDSQGTVQSYTIEGETPEVGETYRRGAQVDLVAL